MIKFAHTQTKVREKSVGSSNDPLDDPMNTTVTLNFRRSTPRSGFSLPTLRVVAGPDMLKFCSIYPNTSVVIGRDQLADLPIADSSVSRRHAMVSSSSDGSLKVKDMGSTNGTTLNGHPVKGERRVQVGDHIETGGVILRVDRLGIDELAHLARVVERLSLANKDPLTGLGTRHFVNEELPAMVKRFSHINLPISIIFLDVDNFKVTNDTYGHSVGDDVLRSIARLMVLSMRDADICVRFGGEELFAVLPNCDEYGAYNTSERLRKSIEHHDWEHYAPGLTVTVSLGVCELLPDEEIDAWFDRADKAMYKAKNAGKNKTCKASNIDAD